jgi:hypothetical protein
MITRDNLKEVLNNLTASDVLKIGNTLKEYIVLELDSYGNFSYELINDFPSEERQEEIFSAGNCILELNEDFFDILVTIPPLIDSLKKDIKEIKN